MRALLASLAGAPILLGLAASAAAVPTAFSGTLSVTISNLPCFTVTATGTADVTSRSHSPRVM